MKNRIKVFFVQETAEKEYQTESLWCKADVDNFIVDNIPFIAERISLGDTIEATIDEDDGLYYFEDFVANSGNTTVRIFIYNDYENKIEEVRSWLKERGCNSEVLLERNIIAVNIPEDVTYAPIKKYLDEGEGNIWTYEESCLEHEYYSLMNSKVIVTYYDVDEKIAEERLWIEQKSDSEYQIKNIPFFAPNLAFNDIISVEDDDGDFYFEDIIKASEHSTIQIVMFDDTKIEDVLKSLEEFGCSWEGMDGQTIIAVDVPPSVNYSDIQEYLQKMLSDNVFDYKEACFSETHQANL
ncbi:DUF4265 domain-containing protein [Chryseobacterium lathyri]|uniref:DUF4265 domain-containing protein n=1 Tax=Chryseobacterium lathyri TaxID=395933 RepID=UPI002781190F|nr:DUF4265 domain-containing protein [Chryseobacterium lathyri]MDQ0065121.1 hypothetical protein [Chryseobacterium lathyri]